LRKSKKKRKEAKKGEVLVTVTINPKEFWQKAGESKSPRNNFLIRPTEEEYWATGKIDADGIAKGVKKRKGKLGTVVEYGCGDGRVALHMAAKCKEIRCVDIAESVLNLAKKELTERGVENASFCVVEKAEEGFADFAYSLQVVQHNPEAEQKAIMQRIYGYLKPGGLACVHLAALETKPGYQNCSTCMCFTREQAEELASVFDEYEIELAALAAKKSNSGDYFVWGRKKVAVGPS
jgi:2-polyprenyl-3-methyl-5-hydroxy-6-metoxy-1,4-benzoquinol methylase